MSADVVVVGGGFAGLVAARDLSAGGRSVVLLEARDRFGGRTWYRPFAESDERVEMGGAWFSLARQPPLAREVERYGVAIASAPERSRRLWRTAGAVREGAPVPRDEQAALAAALRELAAAVPEDVSVAEWAAARVPPGVADFLFAWASFMSGASPDEVSVLELHALVVEGDGTPASLADEIGECFATGSASLCEAIAADCGAAARLGSPVVRIVQTAEGVAVTTADGTLLEASAAVVAVPVNALAGIELDPPLPGDVASVVDEGHPGRSRKLWLLAHGVPDGLAGVGFGTPFQWISAERRVHGGTLVVGFAHEPVEDVEAALRDWVPEARVLALDTHDWVADPWSRGTWMTSRPGWVAGGAYEALARPHGRVVLAGSDVSAEHCGWIAGAIASGAAAAAQVLEALR